MKLIITESQLRKIVSEQPDSRFGPERFMDYKDQMNLASGNHKDMSANAWDVANKKQTEFNRGEGGKLLMQILVSEIPIIGPYLGGALLGYNFQSDYRAAKTPEQKENVVLGYLAGIAIGVGVGAVSSSVSKLGSAGMATMSQKLKAGQALTELETAAANEMIAAAPQVQKLVQEAPKKLSPYASMIKEYKPQFIKKYGADKYDNLIGGMMSNTIDKNQFVKYLKFGFENPEGNFVSQFGVKFTPAEVNSVNKITSFIDKLPYVVKDGIKIFSGGKYRGPVIRVSTKASEAGFVDLQVSFYSTRTIKRMYPTREYLWRSAGFMSKKNEIVLNMEYVSKASKGDIDRLIFHEIGHIKDPALVKSPALLKVYEPEHEYMSDNWFSKYYNHQFERTAEFASHLNTFSVKVGNSIKLMGKDRILKALDSIIGYGSRGGEISPDALWLMDYYEGSEVAGMMKTMSENNPVGYRQMWNKYVQQANYLKTQVKIVK